jgi:predicted RNA polymerase sigma factor
LTTCSAIRPYWRFRRVAGEKRPARYPFYWAALADLQRRADRHGEPRSSFERAMELSRSPAERDSYRRRLDLLRVS